MLSLKNRSVLANKGARDVHAYRTTCAVILTTTRNKDMFIYAFVVINRCRKHMTD